MLLIHDEPGLSNLVEVTWCTQPAGVWLLGAPGPVPIWPGDVLVGYESARHGGGFVPLDFARRPHRV